MHIFTNMCSTFNEKSTKERYSVISHLPASNCTSTTSRSDQYKIWFSQSHTSVKLPSPATYSLASSSPQLWKPLLLQRTYCSGWLSKCSVGSGKAYFDMGCVTSSFALPGHAPASNPLISPFCLWILRGPFLPCMIWDKKICARFCRVFELTCCGTVFYRLAR